MKNDKVDQLLNLYKSGKLVNAEKKAKELIKNDQKNYILYNIYGAILNDQKKFEEAINYYKKSIKINPDYAEGYNNLGSAYYKLKKFNESISSYSKAIKIKPNFSKALNNLGVTFKEIGKLDESVESYQKAIKINPDYAEAYNNLGVTFKEIGKLDESFENYKKAININPNYVEAYNNIGIVYKILGKLDESIKNYKKAININPNYAEAYNNFGNLLNESGDIENAIINYKKAIKINPNFTEVYSNLGDLLREIGKVDEAKECFNKLTALDPKNISYKINSNLLTIPILKSKEEINFYREKYNVGLENLKKYKYKIEKPGSMIRTDFFHLAYHGKDNLELMTKTSNMFKKIIPNINYISKNIKIKNNSKKIKIGFISEFLTSHTVGKLFGGLIKNIDRKKFDVIIFHTLNTKESFVKKEIDYSAKKVIKLNAKINEQQKQIEKKNLDIIFYTDIGMSPTIYFLAFSRLAPIQIVTWGHPETTGISTIDYFLSSALLEEKISKKKYSERLICLSQFPLYYEPYKNIKATKNRTDLGLPENIRLYGCPQSLFKIHPDFDKILSEIISKDPRANIVLIGGKGKEKYWSEILKERWSKNFNNLVKQTFFTKKLNLVEFVSLCNCVDVLLDPIHFGGGNTFLEAMLVGTPTITMPGVHLKNNITSAAYKQMSISSPPIAKNSSEYIDLAVNLANDDKKNIFIRKESKVAAENNLYNNIKALKEFENFLEEAYEAEKNGKKLKYGHTIYHR